MLVLDRCGTDPRTGHCQLWSTPALQRQRCHATPVRDHGSDWAEPIYPPSSYSRFFPGYPPRTTNSQWPPARSIH